MVHKVWTHTVSDVEEGEQGNKANHHSSCILRAGIFRPSDRRYELTDSTRNHTDEHDGSSINEADEEEAKNHTKQARASDKNRVFEWFFDSSNL